MGKGFYSLNFFRKWCASNGISVGYQQHRFKQKNQLLKLLEEKCIAAIDDNDYVLIQCWRYRKICSYHWLSFIKVGKNIRGSNIGSSIIKWYSDSDLLRKFVTLPLWDVSTSITSQKPKTILDELDNYSSVNSILEGEITRYVRVTANGERNVDPLSW